MVPRRRDDRVAVSPLAKAEGHFNYSLKKQGGGPGMYARVAGYLEAYDGIFCFENRVIGGTIPKEFIDRA